MTSRHGDTLARGSTCGEQPIIQTQLEETMRRDAEGSDLQDELLQRLERAKDKAQVSM